MNQINRRIMNTKTHIKISGKNQDNESRILNNKSYLRLVLIGTKKSFKYIFQQLLTWLRCVIQLIRKVDFSNNRSYRWDSTIRITRDYYSYGFIPMDRK